MLPRAENTVSLKRRACNAARTSGGLWASTNAPSVPPLVRGYFNSRARDHGHRALAIWAYDPFFREVPRVHVPAAIRTGPDEMLLTGGPFLDHELVRGAVDHALQESVIERLAEELLRLESRLSDSLGHHVHLDPSLGLRPVRELDDRLFAVPLPDTQDDCDRPRDDRDRPAQVEQFRDIPKEDDEEQSEEQREAADRDIRDGGQLQDLRRPRHRRAPEAPALQSRDTRIMPRHGRRVTRVRGVPRRSSSRPFFPWRAHG